MTISNAEVLAMTTILQFLVSIEGQGDLVVTISISLHGKHDNYYIHMFTSKIVC